MKKALWKAIPWLAVLLAVSLDIAVFLAAVLFGGWYYVAAVVLGFASVVVTAVTVWRVISRVLGVAAVIADAVLLLVAVLYYGPFYVGSVVFGTVAVALFVISWRLADRARGKKHIERMLIPGELPRYETGLHWFNLWRRFRGKPGALLMTIVALISAAIVLLVQVLWLVVFTADHLVTFLVPSVTANAPHWSFGWLVWLGAGHGWLTDKVACVATGWYGLLFLSLPFVIKHVAEWRSVRYVITNLHILKRWGVWPFERHQVETELGRVADVHLDVEKLTETVLDFGSVAYAETGGEPLKVDDIPDPDRFSREIQLAKRDARQHGHEDSEEE